MKNRKFKIIILHISILIIIAAILFFVTMLITNTMRLNNISPTDMNSEKIEEYLNKNNWIFAILGLWPDGPYYKLKPNFKDTRAAWGENWSIPYNSLSCSLNKPGQKESEKIEIKLESVNQSELLKFIKDTDWNSCRFSRDFGPNTKAFTDKEAPRIDIATGSIGFLVIFTASSLFSGAFLGILFTYISTYKQIFRFFKKIFKI